LNRCVSVLEQLKYRSSAADRALSFLEPIFKNARLSLTPETSPSVYEGITTPPRQGHDTSPPVTVEHPNDTTVDYANDPRHQGGSQGESENSIDSLTLARGLSNEANCDRQTLLSPAPNSHPDLLMQSDEPWMELHMSSIFENERETALPNLHDGSCSVSFENGHDFDETCTLFTYDF
jgi:hypothetical protein